MLKTIDAILKKLNLVRRRQYLVNKEMQYPLLKIFIYGSLINIFIIYLSMKYIIFDFSRNLNLVINLSEDEKEIILNLAGQIINNTFCIVAAIVALITYYLLKFSNRAAGPIFNMNRVLKSYKSGNKNERIRIRKKDFFQDLAKNMNEILEENNENNKTKEK